ncbi:MAG: hypothetical protein HZA13_09810 [Nitrospirae bacterium]|nr:hypothetical protein [Nitrospirota bacterium]
MKGHAKIIYILIGFSVLMASCAGTPKGPTPIQELKAPEWVIKGSGAFGGEKGKVFYGIGSATGIRNSSLLRTTADNRARNEVAKIFEIYTASLMKDYAASTTAGDFSKTSEEQHVEQAIKTVTATTLNGVEIVDHWQNPETMELFSMARLDLESFKNNMDKMKELSAQVRDYVRKNAEKMHDQLEKEEEKKMQREGK